MNHFRIFASFGSVFLMLIFAVPAQPNDDVKRMAGQIQPGHACLAENNFVRSGGVLEKYRNNNKLRGAKSLSSERVDGVSKQVPIDGRTGTIKLAQVDRPDNSDQESANKGYLLFEKGKECAKHGDWKGAAEYWEKGLAWAKANNDRPNMNVFSSNLAVMFTQMGDYRKALPYLEQNLEVEKQSGNKRGVCQALFNIGHIYTVAEEMSKARSYFEKSLEIAIELNDPVLLTSIYNGLGIVYSKEGDLDKSTSQFKKSLELARQRGNKSDMGYASLNLGNNNFSLGDYDQAVSFFDQAMQFYREAEDRAGIALTLAASSDAYEELGDKQKALKNREIALKLHADVGDKRRIADGLCKIGLTYLKFGDYGGALSYFEQALQTARQIDIKKIQFIALYQIGLVFGVLGDEIKSRTYMEQALKISLALNHQYGSAKTFIDIGKTYENNGEYETALDYYKKALDFFKDLGKKGESAIGGIGDIYLRQGNLEEARKWYDQIDDANRDGLWALARKQYSEAVQINSRELKKAEESRNVFCVWACLMGLALGHEGLEEFEQSKEFFQKSVQMLEEQRESLTESQRAHFYEANILGFPRILAFQGLARVLEKLGDHNESFRISESVKARLLTESIAKQANRERLAIPGELMEQESKLVNRISGLQKMKQALYKNNQMDRYSEITAELERKKDELGTLIKELRNKFPQYTAVKYPIPLSPDQLLLKQNETLLSFLVTDTGVIWHLVRDRRIAGSGWIEIDKKDLVETVQQYRAAFENVSSRQDLSRHSIPLAKKLYELLLSSPLAQTKPEESIVIVPDGVLGLLPFEALVVSSDPMEYCGEKFNLTYSQSGTSFSLNRSLRSGRKNSSPMFVLADPIFDQEDSRLNTPGSKTEPSESQLQLMRAITFQGVGGTKPAEKTILFSRLEGTGALAKKLEQQFGPKTTVLSGAGATKSKLAGQDLSRFKYIVFATHGVLDEDVPYLKQPALVLSQFGKDHHDISDGFFTMSDVMNTRLACQVAALTACQTGLGRNASGEGVMHLGRGFQYAGANAVLVSLWSVAEESTTFLVEKFFGHLKNGHDAQKALALARQELRKHRGAIFDHPFFWGAFILVGDSDPSLMTNEALTSEESASITPENASRFTHTDDGIILDNQEHLEWFVGPEKRNQDEAGQWVTSLTLDGGGWRLPTLEELKGLYVSGVSENHIDPIFNIEDCKIWSGDRSGGNGYSFDFCVGLKIKNYGSIQFGGRTFAVRVPAKWKPPSQSSTTQAPSSPTPGNDSPDDWQSQLESEYKRAEKYDRDDSISCKAKIDVWRAFLSLYQKDNPESLFDDAFRNMAQKRLAYWEQEDLKTSSDEEPGTERSQAVVSKDLQKAIELLTGHGGKIDRNHARQLFLKAAQSDDFLAKMWLARLYVKGRCDFPVDKEKAYQLGSESIAWIKTQAEEGNPEAQFLMGSNFYDGITGVKDYDKAIFWFKKAKTPAALFLLGYMYWKPVGVARDLKTSFYWFEKAAQENHPAAMSNLGFFYEKGMGVEKNIDKAVFWYRKAAEMEEPGAMNNLGAAYGNGVGVAKDKKKSEYWFRKAAEKGYKLAKKNLQKTGAEMGQTTITSHPEKELSDKGRLFIKVDPGDAKIRILNIGPKYQPGMELKPGSYHLEVSREGYFTLKKRIKLEAGQETRVDVTLW